MAKRTTSPITLDEIIDAFLPFNPTLKMGEIKDYVYTHRGSSFFGYDSKYSFDQTIQAKVQSLTEGGYGFKGNSIFQSVSKGHYRLSNLSFWNSISKKEYIDNQILKLSTAGTVEDLELTTRTLKEVNNLNRNKNLVVGLKKLYDNTCQLCGTKLKISESTSYSEVHHIKSLGEPHNGPDTATNMIVVCPNCHVLLDLKAINICKEKIKLKEPHTVDDRYIDYHNNER